MSERAAPDQYTIVAIVLHWAIAAAIVTNILLGWWMHEAIEEPETAARAFIAYQAHKSIGLSVLGLSLVRLAWRLVHPPPPLPGGMPGWEKFAAKATHWAFYALMIALPLSGWLYVSAGWSEEADQPFVVPTVWFGLFEVPHLFGLSNASLDVREDVAEAAIETHEILVWASIALLALHVGAALKHWLIDRDHVLPQMAPGLPVLGPHEKAPADRKRVIGLALGAALIVAAGLGVTLFLTRPLPAPTPEAAQAGASEDVEMPAAQAAIEETTAAPAELSSVWTVDRARSAIRFSGDQGGVAFNGRFARWRADIRFDPADLEASRAIVTIETASASDGDPMHDSALPSAEWFDSANHPTATFRSERIRHRGGDNYEARGTLTIKGNAQDVDLPFTLTINGDRATMRGRTEVDRREAELGSGTAADEYISRDIGVTIEIEARRGP